MKPNDEKKLDYKNVFQTMFSMPVTRIILIGAGLVALVFVSGQIFRIVGTAVENYKGMAEKIKK